MTSRRTVAAVCSLSVLGLSALPAVLAPATAAGGACSSPTIVGTSKDERLVGTPGPDVIVGRGGNDVLVGKGGNDVLCGGPGTDRLRGGPGDDALRGGTDLRDDDEFVVWRGDHLEGGPGDDLLVPGADPRTDRPADALLYRTADAGVVVDLATGTLTGDGTDRLVGRVREVHGSEHDDVLTGSDGDERLNGYGGSDTIDGGAGNDYLDGDGFLRDELEETDTSDDVLTGGDGRDELWAFAGDDVLDGGRGADILSGGAGLDRVAGGPGRDALNDEVQPGEGQVVDGGPGVDSAFGVQVLDAEGGWQFRAAGVVDLAAETLHATFRGGVVDVRLAAVENYHVGDYSRPWTVRGTDGPNAIYSELTDVRIEARGGNDHLTGSYGDDVIDGGAGFDRADGYGGDDRFISVERRLD